LEITMPLKLRINEDMKTAMRAKDSARLGAIRLLMAAMKQREVDERIDLDDAGVIAVIEKMLKQRKDSITQYEAAKRQDLADAEKFEVEVLMAYMPQALSAAEVEAIINKALADSGAKAPSEMGKVIALIKPQVAGRADMGEISKLVKAKLSSN
jgi:uncharacterized protein YqeY